MRHFNALDEQIKMATRNARVINGKTLSAIILDKISSFNGAVESVITDSVQTQTIYNVGLPDVTLLKLIGDNQSLVKNVIKLSLNRGLLPEITSLIGQAVTGVDATSKYTVSSFSENSAEIAIWTMSLGGPAKSLAENSKKLEDKIGSLFRIPIFPIFPDKKGVNVDLLNASSMFRSEDRNMSRMIQIFKQYKGLSLSGSYLRLLVKQQPGFGEGMEEAKQAALAALAKMEKIAKDHDIGALQAAQSNKDVTIEFTKSAEKDKALYSEYMSAAAVLTDTMWDKLTGSLWRKSIVRQWRKQIQDIGDTKIQDTLKFYLNRTSSAFAPGDFITDLGLSVQKYGIELITKITNSGEIAIPSFGEISDTFDSRGTHREKVLITDGVLSFSGSANEIDDEHVMNYRMSEPFKVVDNVSKMVSKGDLGIIFRSNSNNFPMPNGSIPATELVSGITAAIPHDDRDQVEHTINLSIDNVIGEGIGTWHMSGAIVPLPSSLVPHDLGPVSIVQVPRIMDSITQLEPIHSDIVFPATTVNTRVITWFKEIFYFKTWEPNSTILDYFLLPLASGIKMVTPEIKKTVSTSVIVKETNLVQLLVEMESLKTLDIDPNLALTLMRWDRKSVAFPGISLANFGIEKRNVEESVKSLLDNYVKTLVEWFEITYSADQIRRVIKAAYAVDATIDQYASTGMFQLIDRLQDLPKPWIRLYVGCKLIEGMNKTAKVVIAEDGDK